MQILLTGATGYIGSAVLSRLMQTHEVTTAGRSAPARPGTHVLIPRLCETTDWHAALSQPEVVVHCAGHAHAAGEANALEVHRAANVGGTLSLARQAAERGVRRFVFISSISVNGNESRRPFTPEDAPNPLDPYAVSKHEAERGLWALQEGGAMEVVVVRPPLVYGAGAPGNFARLLRAVRRGVPLPLGAVRNRRSFVALDNLVDLIALCVERSEAANQTFLAADGEDLSTSDFLRRLGRAVDRPARLLPVPVPLLESAAGLLGRPDLIRKLCCDLQVDIGKARNMLNWHPPVSVDEGLRRAGLDSRRETV